MSNALATLSSKLAESFGFGDNGNEVIPILKATAFKGGATDAQLTALLVVSQQYGLNPFTKEIYAFPDKHNGIVPVVGVDGWARIINEHPQFDGLDFEQDDKSCTCVIHRKDRAHPIRITEWMDECCRAGTGPWQSHPKRMLRHKALIQCARLAFGFVGIYDQDEAERIVEIDGSTGEILAKPKFEKPALEYCTQEDFDKKSAAWYGLVNSGKKTAEQLIDTVQTRYLFTDDQITTIKSWGYDNYAS
jgi:hypothetical protein